jgi:hypothetical protein
MKVLNSFITQSDVKCDVPKGERFQIGWMENAMYLSMAAFDEPLIADLSMAA